MIYDRAKFGCGKWRATVTATTYAEAYLVACHRDGPASCFPLKADTDAEEFTPFSWKILILALKHFNLFHGGPFSILWE